MTVQNLIRILQTYPSDMRVVVSGYEEGFDDLSPERIAVVKVRLNQGKADWQGRHLEPERRTEELTANDDIVDALAFFRESN